jgi:hypothetical protein
MARKKFQYAITVIATDKALPPVLAYNKEHAASIHGFAYKDFGKKIKVVKLNVPAQETKFF